MASSRVCLIEGCGKPVLARGWCSAHYSRWSKHGDPLAGGTSWGSAAEYLKNVVLPYRGDECLIWPFGCNGYGKIRLGGDLQFVHRVVCEEVNGPPPTPEHEAAHSCGCGGDGCCAPNHLRWATKAENEADKLIHGTSNRGHRNGVAKLTEADVLKIRRLRQSMPRQAVANMFGVSKAAIGHIDRQERWAWLS